MQYSPSMRGFYSDNAQSAPDDLIPVSDADYATLFIGQASGLEIIPDENGYPILSDTPDLSLADLKINLKQEIDASAEKERLKYITPGAGQAMTYQQKVDEAEEFIAASNPTPSDYPLLAAEVGITAPTIGEVVTIVHTNYQQWQVIGAQIESTRLRAKRDVEAATDKVSARAIVSGIVWPNPQVA